MRTGENLCLITVARCRAAKASPDLTPSFATAISLNSLSELTQKTGDSNLGACIRNRTRRSGTHDGGIAETTTTPLVRCGYRAANDAAMRPPYEIPQMIAEGTAAASSASFTWRR